MTPCRVSRSFTESAPDFPVESGYDSLPAAVIAFDVGGRQWFRRCSIARLPASAPAKTRRAASIARPPAEAADIEAPPKPRDNPAARAFAIELARTLADDRCHQVTVLDVAGISPVTDFFVVATGTSARQMKTAAQSAEDLSRSMKYDRVTHGGDASDNWIILDCFDVIVHLFTQDARAYYDVDGLWGDAWRVPWERPEDAKPAEKKE